MEIAERYDLRLHEWQTSVLTDADFRDAAGLTDGFLTAEGFTASSGTIYEDGSFTYSLRTPAAEWEAGRVLLSCCRAGTLMCWTPALHGGSDYAEWTYTNKNGQELCLAISRVKERAAEEFMPDDDAYWFGVAYVGGIFYEENGWYVSAVGGLASGDDRAALETLADSVAFRLESVLTQVLLKRKSLQNTVIPHPRHFATAPCTMHHFLKNLISTILFFQ